MFLLAPLMLPHGHGCGASMGRWECPEVGGFEELRVGMPECGKCTRTGKGLRLLGHVMCVRAWSS